MLGLLARLYQPVNHEHPAMSSASFPNTSWHMFVTQLELSPQVARKPPYCAPRFDVLHCVEHPLNAPTPPPGIKMSNWSLATSPPSLMAWTIIDLPSSPSPWKSSW